MTLTEIATAASLDPGTTFRMLNTLVDLGYIAKIPESRRFSLTLKVLDPGFHSIGRRDIRSRVRPVLRHLVNDVNEAASFAVLRGADVQFIERVRAGVARLGVDISIGTMMPLPKAPPDLPFWPFFSRTNWRVSLPFRRVRPSTSIRAPSATDCRVPSRTFGRKATH